MFKNIFKNIYLSKIVHSHKNTVFIIKDSHAIYWQDSNLIFFSLDYLSLFVVFVIKPW